MTHFRNNVTSHSSQSGVYGRVYVVSTEWLRHHIQIGSASMRTQERPERKTGLSPPIAKYRNVWSIISTPPLRLHNAVL